MVNKLTLLLFVLLVAASSSAFSQEVDMADVMRSNGKIYVVVGVAAIVMIGILAYLVVLDKKIGVMEKKIKDKVR